MTKARQIFALYDIVVILACIRIYTKIYGKIGVITGESLTVADGV